MKKLSLFVFCLFFAIFISGKYNTFTDVFAYMGGEDGLPQNVSEKNYVITAKITAPVKNGILTSDYGYRIHPISKTKSFHTGVDIASGLGTPIVSAFSGEVYEIGNNQIYGNYIIMRHSESLTTFYGHCDSIKAKQGMRIRAGEIIAFMGSTGYSTGPHLHFEIRINDVRYNPMLVLKEKDNIVL